MCMQWPLTECAEKKKSLQMKIVTNLTEELNKR